MPEIEITVSKEGQPTIEVKGVKGPGCLDLIKPLEAALGQTVSLEPTIEYYEEVDIAETVRQEHG